MINLSDIKEIRKRRNEEVEKKEKPKSNFSVPKYNKKTKYFKIVWAVTKVN